MTLSADLPTAVPEMGDESEQSLIIRARQGDAAAWERLMRQYQGPAFRLAYLILGDPADAEDVAQDAFIRAYLSLDGFNETRPLQPWLLQIVRNLAYNRQRSLSRYWSHLQKWWQGDPETAINPGGQDKAEARILWQAVRQLKPAWQEVIYLRYFLELSEAETAATLDIAPGTVKSRLHRALKALKPLIEHEFIE